MKLQTRIMLLLTAFMVLFMAGLLSLRYSEARRASLLIEDNAIEQGRFFDNVVKLKGSSLEMFVFDYTYWDEMVRFASTPDERWGRQMIDTALHTFNCQAAWVYGEDFRPVYSTGTPGNPGRVEFPLPKTALARLFAQKHFTHFFVDTPDGLMEIRGASIHPTSDVDRKTPPRGYFFAGRVWDKDFIEGLSEITGDTVSIQHDRPSTPTPDGYDRDKGQLTFHRALDGWDGRPAAVLMVLSTPKSINELNRYSSLHFMFFAVFAASLASLLLFFFARWVRVPLQLMSKSLDTENPYLLFGLQKDGSEMGRLAKLIHGFFSQREELMKEVAERRRAEDALTHRLGVEKAIAHSSSMLVSEQKVDLGEVMEMLGQAVKVDRAAMFQFGDDGSTMGVSHEWCAPGFHPLDNSIRKLNPALFPWWMERMKNKECILLSDVSELPEEAAAENEMLQSVGVSSLFAAPMLCSGRLLGFLAFDSSSGTRQLSGEDMALLRSVSDILGAYLVNKRTEEEVIKAGKLESLAVLAGGIAHDFNNLLTVILGSTSAAIVQARSVEVKEYLKTVERAAIKARELTRQLITFSKGGAPLKRIISLEPVIKEYANFALIGSNAVCEYDIDPDLLRANVDEGQVGQVIHNLVLNAEQSMPMGGTVEVSAHNVIVAPGQVPPLKEGRYVRVSIKDHGMGIPEQNLPKVFDPYFTTKQFGSGLGLASAYTIVMKHDGNISVESREGVGSVFYIYLPVSQ